MVFRANFTGISRQLILTVFFVKHRESYTSNSIDCCLEHDEPYEHGQTWNLSRSNIVFDKCKVKLQHWRLGHIYDLYSFFCWVGKPHCCPRNLPFLVCPLCERIQALRFFADEECPLRAAGTEPTVVPGERVHVRGERPDRGTVEADGTWLYLKMDGVPTSYGYNWGTWWISGFQSNVRTNSWLKLLMGRLMTSCFILIHQDVFRVVLHDLFGIVKGHILGIPSN